jgi:predicted lipid-binding transport protein (Tim44 family)
MMNLKSRRSRAVIGLAAVLTLAASVAEARAGRGGGMGSRGSRTWSPPPVTRTAPDAAPIQRSQVPQSGVQRPGATTPQAAPSRGFGFGGGLMAGLLGAGLLGMLFGGGFLGGLGGLASFFGLLIQVVLLVVIARFALNWWRRRQQPAFEGPQDHARTGLGGGVPPTGPAAGGGLGGMLGGLGGRSPGAGGLAGGLGGGLGGALGGLGRGQSQAAQARAEVRDDVGIKPEDFDAFEQSLKSVQAAYSNREVPALWSVTTPEMAGYLQEQLNEDAGKGVIARVTDVQLLQGDLAEAWREGTADFATVAMRFSALESVTEKATGRVLEGDPTKPTEITEIWTFRRDNGGPWKLSAIKQAS